MLLGSECTEPALGAEGKVMEVAVGGAVGTELRPLGCRGLRGAAPASLRAKGCWSPAHLGAQNQKAGNREVNPYKLPAITALIQKDVGLNAHRGIHRTVVFW